MTQEARTSGAAHSPGTTGERHHSSGFLKATGGSRWLPVAFYVEWLPVIEVCQRRAIARRELELRGRALYLPRGHR